MAPQWAWGLTKGILQPSTTSSTRAARIMLLAKERALEAAAAAA